MEHIEKSFYFFFLAPPHSISLLGQALRTFIHIDLGLFAPYGDLLLSACDRERKGLLNSPVPNKSINILCPPDLSTCTHACYIYNII